MRAFVHVFICAACLLLTGCAMLRTEKSQYAGMDHLLARAEYPAAIAYFLFTTWVYKRTGSLWVCILIHGLTNLAIAILGDQRIEGQQDRF